MKQSLEDFLFHLLQYESEPGGSLVHTFAQRIRGCITSCSIGANQDIIAPVVKTAALGIWDKTSEKPSFLDGSLESIQQRKAMKMRKPTDVTPPVIAIFGITQEMLDQSDDDEEDIPIELLSCDSFSPIADTSPTPISRISAGYDMLQPHSGVEIWDFDVKELARQWTLMDHSLFLAIPLTYLQYCQWANPRHVSEANEVRSFIDRFNAESCWVTQSLLNQDTPEKRAALYMKFTFLASFLEELNNFNGLMAILTALQQGCITRLKDTLSYVDEKTNQTLRRLQSLMSGSMNYIKYRERLFNMLDEKQTCVVPHLGAHLAEICSIEGPVRSDCLKNFRSRFFCLLIC
jgi:hypothetical protein